MKDNPCQGCAERHIGCHGECERYKTAVDTYHAKQEKIRGAKEREREFRTFKRERIDHWRKVDNKR